MATRQAARSVSIGWMAVWAVILGACAWFLADAYVYAVTRDQQEGTTLWNRLLWYAAHASIAAPILVIAPLQFLPGLRARLPRVHHWLGRVYLGASMTAALLGIWLGATIDSPGSRIPLVLLACTWFIVSGIAWQAARRRDFVTHRKFVIRSFALALAFVWIRVLFEVSESAFAFIPDEPTRGATREWLAFVVPLLVTEIWLSWWPTWRKLR